jgi:hypothetical protein
MSERPNQQPKDWSCKMDYAISLQLSRIQSDNPVQKFMNQEHMEIESQIWQGQKSRTLNWRRTFGKFGYVPGTRIGIRNLSPETHWFCANSWNCPFWSCEWPITASWIGRRKKSVHLQAGVSRRDSRFRATLESREYLGKSSPKILWRIVGTRRCDWFRGGSNTILLNSVSARVDEDGPPLKVVNTRRQTRMEGPPPGRLTQVFQRLGVN